MKAVMVSICPEWCDRIARGKKTIEIRKNKPNIEPPFKCYIYETKAINRKKIIVDLDGELPTIYASGRGKVIGEFICDRIEYMDMDSVGVGFWENDNFNYIADLGWNTCLSRGEFINYANGKQVYGWHISNLVIYSKPKELKKFRKPCVNDLFCESCAMYNNFSCTCGNLALKLERPPQSWCYVEEVSE